MTIGTRRSAGRSGRRPPLALRRAQSRTSSTTLSMSPILTSHIHWSERSASTTAALVRASDPRPPRDPVLKTCLRRWLNVFYRRHCYLALVRSTHPRFGTTYAKYGVRQDDPRYQCLFRWHNTVKARPGQGFGSNCRSAAGNGCWAGGSPPKPWSRRAFEQESAPDYVPPRWKAFEVVTCWGSVKKTVVSKLEHKREFRLFARLRTDERPAFAESTLSFRWSVERL